MHKSPSWHLRPRIPPSEDLLRACEGQIYLAEALAQRGLATGAEALAFLDPDHYTPAPAAAMIGMTRGATLLREGLETGQRILVWGDFDVDGQASTTLLTLGLRALATRPDQIRWHVPHRVQDNHGIQAERLRPYLESPEWQADILLTCDTGIDAIEGLARARAAGLTVIVTDHHDLPAAFADVETGTDPVLAHTPPPAGDDPGIRTLADAIINPKLLPATHPQYTLPGVGVAFLLMQELYTQMQRAEEVQELLDLVALGIVADIAEQVQDTRYWLQRGLAVLNRTARVGLHALLQKSRASLGTLDTEDIAFSLAPKMNAAGRLDDASLTVELLMTGNPAEAQRLAARIDRLNRKRQDLVEQALAEVIDTLERTEDPGRHAIVLAHKNWHPGILGIVANRVTDMYRRPAVLLHIQEDNRARGSARSVEGVDIGAAIAACSPLLEAHGGHTQAAGVTLALDRLPAFRTALNEAIPRYSDSDRQDGLHVDLEIGLGEINMALHAQLNRLHPTGRGNPEILLASTGLQVEALKRIGRARNHLRFKVRQPGHPYAVNAVWFKAPITEFPTQPVDLAYTLRLNEFRGNRSLELLVKAWRPSRDAAPAPAEAARGPTVHIAEDQPFQMRDMRATTPLPVRTEATEDAIWYAEGLHLAPEDVSTRLQLQGPAATRHLVIWTAPPNRSVLRSLLDARPWQTVAVWACPTPEVSCPELLNNVLRMCRYAVKSRQGAVDLTAMAARLGLSESAIKLSLTILSSQDLIRIVGSRIAGLNEEQTAIATWSDPRSAGPEAIRLEQALQEIKSYRFRFQREGLEQLLA